jgi:hypothetical protein
LSASASALTTASAAASARGEARVWLALGDDVKARIEALADQAQLHTSNLKSETRNPKPDLEM